MRDPPPRTPHVQWRQAVFVQGGKNKREAPGIEAQPPPHHCRPQGSSGLTQGERSLHKTLSGPEHHS